jgi:hypothetical protein
VRAGSKASPTQCSDGQYLETFSFFLSLLAFPLLDLLIFWLHLSMSWNPFSRKDENKRHAWGYDFLWTPQHMTAAEMHPLKYSYDLLGEQCLERLDAISPPDPGEQLPRNRSRPPASAKPPVKRDLYALLSDHSSEDETLGQLWDEVNTIPDWVDWDQIARGQDGKTCSNANMLYLLWEPRAWNLFLELDKLLGLCIGGEQTVPIPTLLCFWGKSTVLIRRAVFYRYGGVALTAV